MKIQYKITQILLLVALGVTATSCSKYLDKSPDDQLTLEMIFKDKTRTEDWLAGIYSNVPDPYWGNTRTLGWDPLSDDMAPSTGWEQYVPTIQPISDRSIITGK